MVRKAIIPAAGYGTRSLPITKVLPKEMLPICGRPAIEFLVEEAIQSGIEQILIVVSRSKNMILDYFDRSVELEAHLKTVNKEHLLKDLTIPDIHIQFVRQPFAEGLGQAILLGKYFVENEPFAVMLPDEIILSDNKPSLLQLIELYDKHKGNLLALKQMEQDELKNYGVIKPQFIMDKFYKVTDIVEKPQDTPPSNLAVVGRYILEPSIFSCLEKGTPGVGGELQLTDAIRSMLKSSEGFGLEIEGIRFDIARQADYIKLINHIYNSNHP